VDIGLLKQGGLVHRYFRRKEKELYAVSDYIGCMSPANVRYLFKHNPEINQEIVEVNPNSIEPAESSITPKQKLLMRQKYLIPEDLTVFIYGGNLGKPQGIGFLIDVLASQIKNMGVYFIVVGSGTEYSKIQSWFKLNQPKNALLISELPKQEYDLLIQSSDVGMIFLDRAFTIPNFPSRLLPYMEYKLPIIAATDKNTDLGDIIEENNFGLWSEAEDLPAINKNINRLSQSPILRTKMGQNGYNFLINNYTVANSYNTIMNHLTT
jgi:glycosyltransferase involved in cell wall biosynthesis